MRVRYGMLSALLALLVARLPAQQISTFEPRVREEVRRELLRAGRAVVLVTFRVDRSGPDRPDRAAYRESVRATGDDLAARLEGAGLVRARRLVWAPCLIAEISGASALDILEASPEVAAVELDQPGHGALLESAQYVRASAAHALGFRGEGRVVAVLDSGIDRDHPAFAGAVVLYHRFLAQGTDTGPEPELAEDGLGHGTHIAGIIASRGGAAPDGGIVPQGLAPAARLIVVKVLKDDNTGWLSDWALGVDHVLGLKLDGTFDVDAINMSLVSDRAYEGDCDDRFPAFAAACQAAVEGGIAILGASGNDGERAAMTAPACYSSVIAVGSVHDLEPDRISSFTNRSEGLDVLAPGQAIVSTWLNGGVSSLSGTSQATPHAAATALLLAQAQPGISPGAIKSILAGSGRPFSDPVSGRTFSILDARAALEAALVPPMGPVSCVALSASIIADWEPVPGADSYGVQVMRDGELLEQASAPAGESRYVLSFPGEHDYDVCVRARSVEGLSGLSGCCSVRVSTRPPFRRGDCDASGAVNISDAVRLLNRLFLGAEGLSCLEACNANDDATLDIADPIYVLSFLFLGGISPPEPHADCGRDPSLPSLGCEAPTCES